MKHGVSFLDFKARHVAGYGKKKKEFHIQRDQNSKNLKCERHNLKFIFYKGSKPKFTNITRTKI